MTDADGVENLLVRQLDDVIAAVDANHLRLQYDGLGLVGAVHFRALIDAEKRVDLSELGKKAETAEERLRADAASATV